MSEHIPVLVKEVMQLLEPKPGDALLDGTLGHGGHARAFLETAGEGSRVIGIDADESALVEAKKNLKEFGDRVTYIHGNFSNLPKGAVQAELFDLGIGSHQLADDARGFSFTSQGALHMQYGDHENLPDSWIPQINDLARQIADTKHLVEVIVASVPKSYEHGRIHPATRTFQALRMAVNRELEVLEAMLPQALQAPC